MKVPNLEGIEQAKRPVFYCSFGKDSSVVLHALRPWLDKIMVVFIDCGGLYPDIVATADYLGAQLPKYFHIHPATDIFQSIRESGWPTDIETEDLGELSNLMARDPTALTNRVRLWTKCTQERVWMPGFFWAQMYKPDLFISGEKLLDRPYATDWEQRTMGAEKVLRPVFDWSDQDIWDYIDANGIELAKSYTGRQADRRDCYVCFGHCLTSGRVDYLKQEYPDLYRKLFHEMGLKKLASAMVEQLGRSHRVWTEIERKLQED